MERGGTDTGTHEDRKDLVRGSRRESPKSQWKVKPRCGGAFRVSQWPGLSPGKGHPVGSSEHAGVLPAAVVQRARAASKW